MITLEANYSKKIGLPGYSSHQFSVTLTTELAEVASAEQESARLYSVLQQSVDQNIQQIGFLPANLNGNGNGNGGGNGQSQPHPQPKPNMSGRGNSNPVENWNCSEKQRDLILKIVLESGLDKNYVEGLAQDRFGKGVKQLNKLEASGIIEELLEETGQAKPRHQRFQKGSR